MNEFLRWLPRVVMAVSAAALLGLCVISDPPKLAKGSFFSDGATYSCDIVTVASNTNLYSSVIGSNHGLVADEHGWGAVLEQMVMDTDLRWACLSRAKSMCAERYHLPDVSRGLAKAMTLEG